MKRLFGKLFVLILMVNIMLCGFGCGSEMVEEFDPNKTQIFVSIYNGGYGQEWFKLLKKDFEADHPDYQIIVTASKDEGTTINNVIKTKQGSTNVYISGDYRFTKDLIDLDCLVDLSDVYSSKAEASESKTIEQKMKNSDVYKTAYSKRDGTGVYVVPYSSGFTGIIFDYDMFVENGWLEFATESEDSLALETQGITYSVVGNKLIFNSSENPVNYEEGDFILTAGKDGKYGTYDDGQPTTISSFEIMLAKIKSSGNYNPFIYATQQGDYIDNISHSIFATYEGEESYSQFYTFSGNYSNSGSSFVDGGKRSVSFEITPETGYETYKMVGMEVATKFMHDYISNTSNYADVVKNGTSFSEAQDNFILGYQYASQSNKAGAMHVDGLWWENESRVTFDSLGSRNQARGYGKREYRFLVYPYIDGQYGIDGSGKGTIYTTMEDGLIFIDKYATDPSMIDICKELVRYTCREKYLKECAKVGCVRPFEFDVSDEYENMTPFVKNVNEMLSDTENIKVLSVPGYLFSSDLSTYGITESQTRISLFVNFYTNPTMTTSQGVDWQYNFFRGYWESFITRMKRVTGE